MKPGDHYITNDPWLTSGHLHDITVVTPSFYRGEAVGLDEAELQPANVNDLISDVAILFREKVQGGIKLEFSFQPVPALMCRPQLLTTVLSSLLSNAFNAANGEGRIVVSTRKCGDMVEIEIEDNGRGMSPEEIETVFDSGFRNSGGRMTSGNWSLFNSRQIVFEHGGDIRIRSVAGRGTTVWVSLPPRELVTWRKRRELNPRCCLPRARRFSGPVTFPARPLFRGAPPAN